MIHLASVRLRLVNYMMGTTTPEFFFSVRKIDPELTSMPILLYFMWDAATAWLDGQGWVCTRDPNLRTPGC